METSRDFRLSHGFVGGSVSCQAMAISSDMSRMSDPTWPPSDELLTWRPPEGPPNVSVGLSVLAGEDDHPPEWVAVPEGTEPDEYGDLDVPCYELAIIETNSNRPGGGSASWVYAVPTTAADLRIVITTDDDIPFVSPIHRVKELPTLGELLHILDETRIGEEVWGVGHPTRQNSDTGHREELRNFVAIRSDLYPLLETLDQEREEQWIAERP